MTASFRSGPGPTIAKTHTAQILLHLKPLRNVTWGAESKLERMNRHGSRRTDLQTDLKGSGSLQLWSRTRTWPHMGAPEN